MSVWTHVAAVIRFDAVRQIRGPIGDAPALGRYCSFDSTRAEFEACDMPCGSEGSLRWELWENPDPMHLAAYTAMIWGDLRDYDNVPEIEAYLERITLGRVVRQGVCEIEVEGRPPVVLAYRFVLELGGKWQRIGTQEKAE